MLFLIIGFLQYCGSPLFESSQRKQTLSARLSDAQYQFDIGNFKKSSDILQEIKPIYPNDPRINIKLSYSLQGQAGLTITQIIDKFIKSTSVAKISDFAKLIGLSDTEKKSIITALNDPNNPLPQKFSSLRSVSPTLDYLHQSWLSVCPVLPPNIINSLPDNTKGPLESTKCGSGSTNYKSSALLSSLLESFASGISLYQVILDPNGTGEIVLVTQGTALITKIQALKDSVATSKDPVGTLGQVNDNVSQFVKLLNTMNGELVSLSISKFSTLSLLIASIPGIPGEVKAQVDSAVKSFSDSKKKLDGYLSQASSTTSSSQPSDVQASAKNSASSVDTLYAQACVVVTSTTCHDFKCKLKTGCANFDALGAYVSGSKPASCTNITYPTDCP